LLSTYYLDSSRKGYPVATGWKQKKIQQGMVSDLDSRRQYPAPARRYFVVAGFAGLLATTLGACSSTLSELPSAVGGLPTGTPERPVTPTAYPAVHDMPPPREDVVLTDAELRKAQEDLQAARDRQTKRSGTRDAQ
jgi:hypothetical protein